MNDPPTEAWHADTDDVASFLLNPEVEHASIERRLVAFTSAEVEAVDQYLSSQAASAWTEVKSFHELPLRADCWRLLWPVRVAARLLLAEKERGNPAWQALLHTITTPLKLHPFEVSRAGVRYVVVSGGFLDAELTRSFHPSITGSRLFCETPDRDRLSDLVERYRVALALLENYDPKGFSVFTGSVSAIVPLELEPPLEPGKCVSLSIAAAPGVVLLTMIPIILLSETLLHEAAHCRLSAAESLAKLWVSSGVRVASPLRPDPRPIAGLYHQAYVVMWLSRYYCLLREATQERVIQRNRRQIDKRIEKLTSGLRTAVSTLRGNVSELTPLGVTVLEAMASEGGVR